MVSWVQYQKSSAQCLGRQRSARKYTESRSTPCSKLSSYWAQNHLMLNHFASTLLHHCLYGMELLLVLTVLGLAAPQPPLHPSPGYHLQIWTSSSHLPQTRNLCSSPSRLRLHFLSTSLCLSQQILVQHLHFCCVWGTLTELIKNNESSVAL